MKSWVMPSVEEILIFAGVDVDSGVDVGFDVDVNEICVGTGVSEGAGVFIVGTAVVVAP